jgi:class 3 adenylate cyclase/tetratricopeptide (TPR) repeat protein
MTFEEIVDQAIEMIQRRGRVTYRMLKRQFDLDDEALEDLKEEIIDAQRVAVEEDGRILIWTGDTQAVSPPTSIPVSEPIADQNPPPISYTPKYLTERILTSRSALEGERKQVTVLFADIKDSTELIKDLDPEDAQKLLDPAIHIMMDAVHRFEGTVNQVLGDGIMALFGAPLAHEDHAARACYAALAMQTAMQPYADETFRSHGITMRMRVGLNSGEVVVRTIGNDLHMDYSAVGRTTNLASRMEQLAAPGSITLTGATLRLVEGLVRVHARGPVPVKGMTEPVEVYELTGASTIKRRLQAAVARGLTTFVGRDTEIDALNQALEKAATGRGQIVAAVGEAGVGKSRLMYEFLHSYRTQGWRVLESASVSYGKAEPYFPVVELLKRYVHVEEGDDARMVRAKVTGQIVTLDASLQETIPPLLSLLHALPEDSPFFQLDPSQKRQRTLDGLKQILLRESQEQPLLLVFEDLHWIDSETQALLDSVVESLPTAQLLLLVNYRPEYTHGWGSKTFYTQLRLDPLRPGSAEAFLAALLGDDASLEPLKKLLIERTEGNPFFLEESVRTLVETQVLVGEQAAYRLARDLPPIHVPATVQAILAARIDRLPQDDKRLLQMAAVIGTEVPLPLLQAIAEWPHESLYRGLTHLQAAEFLYETSLFPERAYTFKHALTHEVAYTSLLHEQRRVLHARIVEVLEQHGDENVHRLAHHAFRGERWDKAMAYYQQAGTQAVAHSAYQEAITCFEQALAALGHVPANRHVYAQSIDLRVALQGALHPLGRRQTQLEHLREAERLAAELDDPRRRAHVNVALGRHYWWIGDQAQVHSYAQQALAIAERLGDVHVQSTAMYVQGLACLYQGEYTQAMVCFKRTIALLDDDPSGNRISTVGYYGVFAHATLCLSCAHRGAFAEGLAYAAMGLRLAEMADHLYSRIVLYWSMSFLHAGKGDLNEAIPLCERALDLCRSGNIPRFESEIGALLGAALVLSGRVSDAVPLLEAAVELGNAMDFRVGQPRRVIALGDAYLAAGRVDAALTQAQQALASAGTLKQPDAQAYALYLLGRIARHGHAPHLKPAATHYGQALDLANELGMRPLQAHCHHGLGTLYSQTQ